MAVAKFLGSKAERCKTWLAVALVALTAAGAEAEPAQSTVQRCLSCHLTPDGSIDIIGLSALDALPPEWPFLYEDAFDLDADGVAGRMRMVSGAGRPLVGKYGSQLAAGRFRDFAMIAGAAHDIALSDPETLAAIEAAFLARSPAPVSPFASDGEMQRFEARGCASCHVTRSFRFDGQEVMPLSDFLLHDVGNGLKRTAPLWGCEACVASGLDPHTDTGG